MFLYRNYFTKYLAINNLPPPSTLSRGKGYPFFDNIQTSKDSRNSFFYKKNHQNSRRIG